MNLPPALDGCVRTLDGRVDEALEPWRARPGVVAVMQAASTLGDFSLVWHLAGAARAVRGRRQVRQALVLSALLGVESLVVNQGIKRLVRRQRPTEGGDERTRVRRPSTSSFPSGHASSATVAAIALIGWDGRRSALVWVPLAATVAVSRAFVRIHWASDVVGGVVVGGALGAIARRVARRFA